MHAGGASNWTAALAGVVALVLYVVTGPLGILLGVAGTVFVVEFYRQEDARLNAWPRVPLSECWPPASSRPADRVDTGP